MSDGMVSVVSLGFALALVGIVLLLARSNRMWRYFDVLFNGHRSPDTARQRPNWVERVSPDAPSGKAAPQDNPVDRLLLKPRTGPVPARGQAHRGSPARTA